MSLNGINYQPYAQYNSDTQYQERQRVRYNTDDENVKGIVVGSAKSEAAKSGVKFFKKVKNFVVKVFKGDTEAQQKVVDAYDTADKIHQTIDVIQDLSDNSSQKPKSIDLIA